MRTQTTGSGPQALNAIYAALALGVLAFAAIVLFVLEPRPSALDSSVMRLVWLGTAVVATLAAGIVRGRMSGPGMAPERVRTAAVTVWALTEGQALVGIVGTMMTGDRVTAYGSLALFVWLWMRYPPRSFTGT